MQKVYKADGAAHSWDWLALVSPCIDILRKLSTKINSELGSNQGAKHTVPDLQKDINVLMSSLKEYRVYNITPGRVVDSRDHAVPDVFAVGLAQLSYGGSTNPIAEFNQQFERMRERRKLTPITETTLGHDSSPPSHCHPIPSKEPTQPTPLDKRASEETGNIHTAHKEDSLVCEADSDVIVNTSLADSLLQSPTLEQVNEDDVALDMDGWDLDSENERWEDSDDSEEEVDGIE